MKGDSLNSGDYVPLQPRPTLLRIAYLLDSHSALVSEETLSSGLPGSHPVGVAT